MVDEHEIDATMIKIGKEYRWCILEERDSYLYAYKDILSEKRYPPRDCLIIKQRRVKITVSEIGMIPSDED